MDSGIHIQLAHAKLQDSLRDAEIARSARAVPRPPHERPETRLATAWRRKLTLNGPAATTSVLRRRRFRTDA